MDRAKKYLLSGVAVACLAAAGWLLYPVIMDNPAARVQPTAPQTPTLAGSQAEEATIRQTYQPQESATDGQAQMIQVSIKGKVLYPGEYYIAPGSTVADAIELAGGILEGADTSKLDMASLLYNNQYIGIP